MRSDEKSKLFEANATAALAEGTPIAISFAAWLAGVTRQRIWMLIEEGTLKHVNVLGWNFVTLESLWRWRMGSAGPHCAGCRKVKGCPQFRKP